MSDYEKYFKVIYRSEPIGKEKIILELMTFDIEAFERQKTLKEIPAKTVSQEFNIAYYPTTPKEDYMQYLEKQLNNKIDDFYKKEINKLKSYIEEYRLKEKFFSETRSIDGHRLKEKFFSETRSVDSINYLKGNVTNSDNIVCDIIQGNVINCDNVKVKEIRGNTINCEIYKE